MARWVVVAALLAALIGGGAALIIRAQSDDPATELRLSARRLDDGTVELGLQRRTPDGWSARILPDGRFLSLEIPNNEWLNSAAFALSEPDRDAAETTETPAPAADDAQATDEEEQATQQEQEQADSAGAETAEEAVDDGGGDETAAAEPGAEEDPGGGEQAAESAPAADVSGAFAAPADRIIEAVNDARALRAAAPPPPSYEVYLVRLGDTLSGIAHAHGIRLARLLEFNSLTPETLIYPDDELLIPSQTDQRSLGRVVTTAVGAAIGADGTLPYVPIEAPFEMIGESTAYGTIRDQGNGAIHSTALTVNSDGARLVVACSEGELVAFVRLPSGMPELSTDRPVAVRVHYFLDDGRLRSDRWRVRGEGLFAAPDAEGFMTEIGGAERIDLRVEAGDASVNLTFSIADLLRTPIQPNLDRCGAPAPPLSGPAD